MSEIRDKAAKGLMWAIIEKFGAQIFQFITSVIIARILTPTDYGLVGILMIFVSISSVIIDGGFASALIQRKTRNQTDYSTVFYFNLFLSVFLYVLLWLIAPFIASFYAMPELVVVSRIYFITLIFSSATSVIITKLRIELNFGLQSKITVFFTLISGIIGIVCAVSGLGVWALVIQALALSVLTFFAYIVFAKWLPSLSFSVNSLREMFSFGSKLLLQSLINRITQNIYGLVIGKYCSPADLGLYNRANHFSELPADSAVSVLNKVNYPILVKYQDDNVKLRSVYSRLLTVPMFVLFPVLVMLSALSEPIVLVILGEKWLPCAPLMSILALGYLWYPMSNVNLNLLYVKGRSDLSLKLEIRKKPMMILLLLMTVPFGVIWIAVGRAAYSMYAFALNCRYTKKLMGYGLKDQFFDVLPIFVYSAVSYLAVVCCKFVVNNPVLQLIAGGVTGLCIYLLVSYVFKDKTLLYIISFIKEKLHAKKKSNP